MRELTQKEIDQVSAGPTPFEPVAIPTIHHAATSSMLSPSLVGLSLPLVSSPLAEGTVA